MLKTLVIFIVVIFLVTIGRNKLAGPHAIKNIKILENNLINNLIIF